MVIYTALCNLPERKQRVQACTRFGVPSTIALTFFTFGLKVLFERLCECDNFIPNFIHFPQISHLATNIHLLQKLAYLLILMLAVQKKKVKSNSTPFFIIGKMFWKLIQILISSKKLISIVNKRDFYSVPYDNKCTYWL